MIGTEVTPQRVGELIWVNGPVVRARGSEQVGMYEVVLVGAEHLVGEVIGLDHREITIQVYEETSGLGSGMPVYGTGAPLSVELGPGLMSSVFDGLQRPLTVMEMRTGAWIGRGIRLTPLYRKAPWPFSPVAEEGIPVSGGSILGVVRETALVEHRVMVPPGLSGRLVWLAGEGPMTLEDEIARIDNGREVTGVTMMQRWPVRRPRPYLNRLRPSELLTTGQRVLDTFFSLPKGGTAAIPGGFGAGKTVLQHQVAKWSDADVIVYVGCGERGNEMADVLRQFPELRDPRSGHPLMERTILIVNTSNMPVAAREASLYTGLTVAEYYRDMGLDVAMMADSTSRWAEALREISGRLEELPAEEGFPAYLSTRLAEFYERAGRVTTFAGATGSVSLIGAVSPPGADFTEPVTQQTRRFVRCFWALDKELAAQRHFPAVDWLESYSQYVDDLAPWWEARGFGDWAALRARALEILQREGHLQQIVQLIGADALPDDQRLLLETARLLREGFLQQDATDPIDTFADVDKQVEMLKLIVAFHDRAAHLIAAGCPIGVVRDLPVVSRLLRVRQSVPNDRLDMLESVARELSQEMDTLERSYT
jgi:V/A-type H+/Na+-transporting ATPase subunit A